MFFNKGDKFIIVDGDYESRVELSQNLWILKKKVQCFEMRHGDV